MLVLTAPISDSRWCLGLASPDLGAIQWHSFYICLLELNGLCGSRAGGYLLRNPHVLKDDVLFSHNELIRRALHQIVGISSSKSGPHQ
jgi:hypothetical protein